VTSVTPDDALRAWATHGGTTIDWTRPDAYAQGIRAASQFLPAQQAAGFAALRYRDATGHWPELGCGHRAGTCTGPGPCDTTPFGAGKNWVNKVGGLPAYIRAVAHAFTRNGLPESEAIARAVGVIRNWAEGKGNVTAATRARAAKALAEWEAKKAAAHGSSKRSAGHPAVDAALSGIRDDGLNETGSASALLPTAPLPKLPTHRFKPKPDDAEHCATCGATRDAAVHQAKGERGLAAVSSALEAAGFRHAGHGHHAVPSGHLTRNRRQTLTAIHRQADNLEPAVQRAMAGLFAQQKRATIDRLNGRRGQQMIRAATPPDDPTPPPSPRQPPEQPAPLVDASQVYDMAFWAGKIRDTLDPILGAVVSLTADRFAAQLGEHEARSSLGAVGQVLDERLARLAQLVSQTTFDDVAQVLRQGVIQGQTIAQMTAALEKLFDDAQSNRAPTIARTETLGTLNQAAATYADNLPADVVAGREWLSAHDDRVRPTHVEADGQIRAMGMPFEVGGFPLAFPHDPAAPPSETVNCRCSVAYLTPAEYAKRTQPASVAA
jgi:SPP1 gp7 family putative phage head morphogenesis protein